MSKKLLLHSCCAPCMSQSLLVLLGQAPWERVLEYTPDFDITIFYYNPNITPKEEYDLRYQEVSRLAKEMAKLECLKGNYDNDKWDKEAQPLKDAPERGTRCMMCYNKRLEETFITAKNKGFDIVASTLTLSPLKNAMAINRIGIDLSKKYNIEYLVSDFKKQEGFKNSIKLSEKYHLYRQNYCGCVYSIPKIK